MSTVRRPEPAREAWPSEAAATLRQLAGEVEVLRARTAQLQQALDSRVALEQAKGVLAERLGIRPDDAFELLRRAARSTNVRLHDLATEVVVSRATPAAVAREVARSRREEG